MSARYQCDRCRAMASGPGLTSGPCVMGCGGQMLPVGPPLAGSTLSPKLVRLTRHDRLRRAGAERARQRKYGRQ